MKIFRERNINRIVFGGSEYAQHGGKETRDDVARKLGSQESNDTIVSESEKKYIISRHRENFVDKNS